MGSPLFFGRLSIFSFILVTCCLGYFWLLLCFVCLVDVVRLHSADLLDDISLISSLVFFTQSGRQYVNEVLCLVLAS